ncbi:hypothetical protein [Altererythrobacter lauratis]|uniref:Terminase n=1 Tax=Alteraurantiacibacter lauratis TaxID=2054627 RepID=A0ABV7EI40_9SPHN
MPQRTKINPALRVGEKDNLDRHWRTRFLDTLAETSNVSEAARRAGINPSRAYKVRREEAAFRQKWNAALVEGYDHLELETLHRLRMGVEAGKDDRKFDIANALRLLTLHRETAARERALTGEDDEESVLAELNARLEAMRAREGDLAELFAQGDGSSDAA